MNRKTIKEKCRRHGFDFEHNGGRHYVVSAMINDEKHVWECASLYECDEAIFQAKCLKKWQPAGV